MALKPLYIISIKSFWIGANLLLHITSAAIGQNIREQVTIVGTFQPSIKESSKMELMPEPLETPLKNFRQALTKVDTTVALKTEPEPLTPLQVEVKEQSPSLRNHLNLGAGTNLSPVFDFMHHSALSKSFKLNILASHRSSWTQVRDLAPSDWMANKARVSTDIYLREQSIHGGLAYNHNRYHWYGFRPSEFPLFDGDKRQIMQHLGLFSADVFWETNFSDPKSINHYLGLNLNFLNDRYRTFDHAFALSGGASKEMDVFRLDGTQYAAIDAGISYVAEGDSLMSKSTFLVRARPSFGLKGSFYGLEVAMRFNSAQAERTYMLLIPELQAKLFIFQDRMSIFANVGGRLDHHSRRLQWSENPYLRSTDSSFVTTMPLIAQFGIKGNPLKGLEIKCSFEHSVAEQMGFFVIDTTSAFRHLYTTLLDDARRNRFTAELRYNTNHDIRAHLTFHYDKYELDALARPWHRPQMQLITDTRFPLNSKFAAKASALWMGGRFAPDDEGREKKLKNVTDISLGAEYQHKKNLWFYSDIENLLNQRYPHFDGYPVQGAQIVLGMKLNF